MTSNKPQRIYQETPTGSAAFLVAGFAFAILLTLAAYLAVVYNVLTGWPLIVIIMALAVAQMAVQLVYFLHLGKDSKSHWKLMLVCVTVFIVCTVVVGSLWIMNNLNSRMTPQQMNDYMNSQQSF